MASKFTLIVFTFFNYLCVVAQQPSFSHQRSWQGDIVQVSIDNLDQVYVVSSTNQVKKLSASGDSLAVYNDIRRFGKLYSIDATNPLKILLFFKDFNTIVVLDRFLNQRQILDLRKHDILQATAVGLSYDNNIWVYDALNFQLKRISEDGQLISETPDLRLATDMHLLPQKLIDRDGWVYLYDSTKGLQIFDYYGSLKNQWPFTGWRCFQVNAQSFWGISKNTWEIYSKNAIQHQSITLPSWSEAARQVWIGQRFAYVLNDQQLVCYEVRWPSNIIK